MICNTADLCKLIAERVGQPRIQQLQYTNGAFVTSMTEFLDDNPGAIEALEEFINEYYPDLKEEEGFEDESDESEDEG